MSSIAFFCRTGLQTGPCNLQTDWTGLETHPTSNGLAKGSYARNPA